VRDRPSPVPTGDA
jgi:hypothetical protein